MSLHGVQFPHSIRALRAAAPKATGSKQLEAIVRDAVLFHGPLIGLGILGSRHDLMTGKKAADELHEWVARRMSRVAELNRDEIYRRVGNAMMDTSERLAFDRLTRKPKINLTRFTNLTIFTGWYETVEDARASWRFSNPPTAFETLDASARQIMAVKWLNARYDIVPVPNLSRLSERTLLT